MKKGERRSQKPGLHWPLSSVIGQPRNPPILKLTSSESRSIQPDTPGVGTHPKIQLSNYPTRQPSVVGRVVPSHPRKSLSFNTSRARSPRVVQGERTRPACRWRRPAANSYPPSSLSQYPQNYGQTSFRRDASNHTRDAYAPRSAFRVPRSAFVTPFSLAFGLPRPIFQPCLNAACAGRSFRLRKEVNE